MKRIATKQELQELYIKAFIKLNPLAFTESIKVNDSIFSPKQSVSFPRMECLIDNNIGDNVLTIISDDIKKEFPKLKAS